MDPEHQKEKMTELNSSEENKNKSSDSYPASSAHCVHKNCEYNVLEVLVTATILQNLNREKIIEIIHSAERGLT